MKKILPFVVVLAGTASAQDVPDPETVLTAPSSYVAWTPETIALLDNSDPVRGEVVHNQQLCSSCHGSDGIGRSPNWPNLAGQVSGYTYKSLTDYHDWERSIADGGELMGYIVAELTEQDIADLAAFYAAQTPSDAQDVTITQEQFDIARRLHLWGDPDRLIQPCSGCHGRKGKGEFPNYPSLAGQYAEYTELQMRLYRSGERHSDIYSRMRLLSAELTDLEIEAIARFYARMGNGSDLASEPSQSDKVTADRLSTAVTNEDG